jgi:drug/metabolite transporter (DMT)-like permease
MHPIQSIRPAMGPREWASLAVLSVIWGGSFFFVGVAVTGLPPFTIVLLRVGLAALALHLVVRALRLPLPRDARIWKALVTMALLNNLVPFSLIVWGQTHIASGLASILNATTPLFGVLFAHLGTTDERLNGRRLAGVGLGLGGVVLLLGPEALRGLGSHLAAQLAVLAAAACYALASVYGRRFARLGLPPLITATGQVTASTLMLLPLALAVDRPWSLPFPGAGVLAAVAGLALVSTACAYILYFRLLASSGATNILLVTFLIPVSAILLGTAFLGERIEPMHLIGMGLIGLGLAAIDGRLWRRVRLALTGNRGAKGARTAGTARSK